MMPACFRHNKHFIKYRGRRFRICNVNSIPKKGSIECKTWMIQGMVGGK
jgi:hypothetical protein